MNRRQLFQLASGLFVPWEPERVYSFLPAWRLVSRWVFDNHLKEGATVFSDAGLPPDMFRSPLYTNPMWSCAPGTFVIHPSNLLDVQKSAEAFGVPVRFG